MVHHTQFYQNKNNIRQVYNFSCQTVVLHIKKHLISELRKKYFKKTSCKIIIIKSDAISENTKTTHHICK